MEFRGFVCPLVDGSFSQEIEARKLKVGCFGGLLDLTSGYISGSKKMSTLGDHRWMGRFFLLPIGFF